MLFVTLLPKKETKGSTCFRHEIDLIVRTLCDADGIVEKVEASGFSSKTVEDRTVTTIQRLCFSVTGLSAGEIRLLLHEIEDQISMQGEGVRIFVATTGAPIVA